MGKTVDIGALRGKTAPPSRTALIQPQFTPRFPELIEELLESDRPYQSLVSSELFAEQHEMVCEEIDVLMDSMTDLDLGSRRRWTVHLAQAMDRPAPDLVELQDRFFSNAFLLLSDQARDLSEPAADLLLEASQIMGQGRPLNMERRVDTLRSEILNQESDSTPTWSDRLAVAVPLLAISRMESGEPLVALRMILECKSHFDGIDEEVAYELVEAFRGAS